MTAKPAGAPPSGQRPHPLRRLYDWTLSWAHRPGGVWALFFIAIIESSMFPIPPDVLLIALCVAAPRMSFRFALVCSIGSVLGGVIGYGIGYWGFETIGEPIVRFYHGEAVMQKIKAWYDVYGFWGNLAAAITPIPYKVFTIASGAFKFSFGEFLLASVIGRPFRFFTVATVIFFYGAQVRLVIEKYFDRLAWALLALGVGGFVALKFLK